MAKLTHKIALQLTPAQEQYCKRAAGVQRFAYNLALAKWEELYAADRAAGVKRNATQYQSAIQKWIDANKRELWPWMLEISKGVPQGGVQNLVGAFIRFFKKASRYPKLKKKNRCTDSFRADGNSSPDETVRFSGKYIRFPVLGWVRGTEEVRFDGKLQRVTIKREGVRWFAFFVVETNVQPVASETQAAIVGVDLGLKHLAVLSTGEKFDAPKPLAKSLRRMKRAQQTLARRPRTKDEEGNKRDSGRRIRARDAVAKIHYRIKCVRHNALHEVTSYLAKNFKAIAIEDLNVAGMLKNRSLARAISDVGFGEFRRQLTYKTELYGSRLVVCDRWFASSKTCSTCNHVVDELPLSIREWTCKSCGAHHDRDVNAARNLANVALRQNLPDVKRVERTASAMARKSRKQAGSVKREVPQNSAAQAVVGGY